MLSHPLFHLRSPYGALTCLLPALLRCQALLLVPGARQLAEGAGRACQALAAVCGRVGARLAGGAEGAAITGGHPAGTERCPNYKAST